MYLRQPHQPQLLFMHFTKYSYRMLSATGVAVTQTQDVKPTAAVAGPAQPNLCTTSATLAATAANNGGTGTWTIVGPADPS